MYQHNIFCYFFSSSSSSSIELFHSSYCSAHHLSHFNPNFCFTSVVLIHSSRYSFCSASFLCFGVLFCCSSSSNVLFHYSETRHKILSDCFLRCRGSLLL